jgi:hypothetical protein
MVQLLAFVEHAVRRHHKVAVSSGQMTIQIPPQMRDQIAWF